MAVYRTYICVCKCVNVNVSVPVCKCVIVIPLGMYVCKDVTDVCSHVCVYVCEYPIKRGSEGGNGMGRTLPTWDGPRLAGSEVRYLGKKTGIPSRTGNGTRV